MTNEIVSEIIDAYKKANKGDLTKEEQTTFVESISAKNIDVSSFKPNEPFEYFLLNLAEYKLA